jgi:hypothetical protein
MMDKYTAAANRVWKAFLAYGPVDDGRPEGDKFDEALTHLPSEARQAARSHRALWRALDAIVRAWESVGDDEQVPESLNRDELWMRARAALALALGNEDAAADLPDLFEET